MDHTIRFISRATGAILLGLAVVGWTSAPAPKIHFAPTIKVTGTVTDGCGAPLQGGTMALSGIGHAYGSFGTIKEDGTYTLSTFEEGDGAPPGEYNVNITDSDGDRRTVSSGNPATVEADGGNLDFQVD